MRQGYAAGPLPRVTVAVCDCPDWSSQVSEILSPGWYLTRACWMSLVEETVWPATEVIVSPAVRPALAAAEPDRAPAMVTPLLVPLPLPSPCPPKRPKPAKPPESPEPLPSVSLRRQAGGPEGKGDERG